MLLYIPNKQEKKKHMLLKCLFEVIRKELFLKKGFILFLVNAKCHKDQLKVQPLCCKEFNS